MAVIPSLLAEIHESVETHVMEKARPTTTKVVAITVIILRVFIMICTTLSSTSSVYFEELICACAVQKLASYPGGRNHRLGTKPLKPAGDY